MERGHREPRPLSYTSAVAIVRQADALRSIGLTPSYPRLSQAEAVVKKAELATRAAEQEALPVVAIIDSETLNIMIEFCRGCDRFNVWDSAGPCRWHTPDQVAEIVAQQGVCDKACAQNDYGVMTTTGFNY